MAAMPAGMFAVPVGIFPPGRAEITLVFIGAAALFLRKIMQPAMKAHPDAAIEASGKNKQVKSVFRALFVAMAGLALARAMDPVTARQVVQEMREAAAGRSLYCS